MHFPLSGRGGRGNYPGESGPARINRCPRFSATMYGMAASVSGFYDEFASDYHLLFEDWEASITRQAAVISSILERECLAVGATVLDCACGIGTQTLGLAKLGFCITG